ncbi:MAG: HD domain-containing protein [Bacteroidetes bacterium]|nr:MAG: HD domain-containing protein [Bacteroidota bacterium]
MKISESIVKQIGQLADELGVELYIVGGYVRDYFLGRNRIDFDFTVVGDSIAFAKEVARKFNSKPVIYQKFRTALVPVGGHKIEFVGTRKEEYNLNSRKPVVTEGTLEDDLRRRDFTINAMAVCVNEKSFGSVIDLFNGFSDLNGNILKTPLNPEITFSDDPLRMMRAARFASQLNFKIHHETLSGIMKTAVRIKIISQERITDEFIKIISSAKPSGGLKVLNDTGLLKYIFPELHRLNGIEFIKEEDKVYGHKDVFLHSLQVLDNICEVTNNPWLRFAALTHDIAKSVTKKYMPGTGWTFHGHEELGARRMSELFRRMKFPMEHLPYVEKLVRLHQRPMVLVDDGVTDSAVRRLAFQAGEVLEDLFILCKADITTKNPILSVKYLKNYDKVAKKVMDVQEKDKLREFQAPVRGEEIMDICGIKPSPVVGFIKSAIEEAILDNLIPNEYEPAKEYFLKHKDEWLKEAESIELSSKKKEIKGKDIYD